MKTKDKNSENMPCLEITEIILIYCDIVNNDSKQNSRVLYTSVPHKSFGQLLEVLPTNFMFLKIFDSEFPCIEV